MNKNGHSLSTGSALLLFAAFALPTGNAAAQGAKDLAGTYLVVSNPQFGDNSRGQLILGQDGRYASIQARATLPKVAAGKRVQGTAEENKAIVGGSVAQFGTYTVDEKDKTITFNTEVSTFPNLDGTMSRRAFTVSGDRLTVTNKAPSNGGGTNAVVWRRIK